MNQQSRPMSNKTDKPNKDILRHHCCTVAYIRDLIKEQSITLQNGFML